MMNSVSKKGIDFIKRWEGLRLTTYVDSAGVPTIGYGHTKTVLKEDVFAQRTIKKEQADWLLDADVREFEDRVNKVVDVSIEQHEFDALVSFDFNTGGLHRSTVLKRLNNNDRQAAAEALLWWNKATIGGRKIEIKGLARRREAERALFLASADAYAKPA